MAPCDFDASQVLSCIVADPRIFEPYYVSRTAGHETITEWTQRPEAWHSQSRLNLAVRLRSCNAVIGLVQFTSTQIAYFVHPDYWWNGYGSEMVSAACLHIPCALGIRRLEASVIRENSPSRHILEKCGFAFKGLAIRDWSGGSGSVTMLRYERLYASET
jgi:RimJ/RimL family protein N-acetyltransferase